MPTKTIALRGLLQACVCSLPFVVLWLIWPPHLGRSDGIYVGVTAMGAFVSGFASGFWPIACRSAIGQKAMLVVIGCVIAAPMFQSWAVMLYSILAVPPIWTLGHTTGATFTSMMFKTPEAMAAYMLGHEPT